MEFESQVRSLRQASLLALILALASPLFGWEQSPGSMQDVYAAIAEKAFPAVVVVGNYQYKGRTFVRAGVGSGFLVRADGCIATNYHVIKNAVAIAVKLSDNEVVPAKVIASDSDIDLAVIRIYVNRKLPYLKFADTAKVKVGHYAIAIGAPFSLSHTMTTGIVSHKGRKLNGGYYEDYIQTDAAVNPGNSGGPLLDITGKVIGINSCMLSPGGQGNAGIGFAIDGNLAKKRIDAMIRSSSKSRPVAGFGMCDTYPPGSGAKTSRVVPRSPAEKAGLRIGDVITKIGNRPIANIYDAQSIILNHFNPGDVVEILYIRNGKIQKTKICFEKDESILPDW